jgi:hypothetical protein
MANSAQNEESWYSARRMGVLFGNIGVLFTLGPIAVILIFLLLSLTKPWPPTNFELAAFSQVVGYEIEFHSDIYISVGLGLMVISTFFRSVSKSETLGFVIWIAINVILLFTAMYLTPYD